MGLEYAVRLMVDAIRKRRVYYAFPGKLVRRLRIINSLPRAISDWLIGRALRKIKKV
jgi:hypothetical protein